MKIDQVKYVLFDVADTLLTKGDIPLIFAEQIANWNPYYKSSVIYEEIKKNFYSEKYNTQFPDITGKDFYSKFNQHILKLSNIDYDKNLLISIMDQIKSLQWKPFDDSLDCLSKVKKKFKIGILSNWDTSLKTVLTTSFPGMTFDYIAISSEIGTQKPDKEIFDHCTTELKCSPQEILFIGDSPRIDFNPALNSGFQAVLLDRHNLFNEFIPRVDSLKQITKVLNCE